MDFQETLAIHFPGALSEESFVEASSAALNRFGFRKENAIACIGVCRDEITRPLVDRLQSAWGDPLVFSGLGGMLFMGKTGLSAAHHHAPVTDGRERFVHFAMAHIAIDKSGEIGVCCRPGRPGTSGACGALMAMRQEMAEGCVHPEPDPLDPEFVLLKQRLLGRIPYGEIPDLVSLTKIVHEIIAEDLEQLVEATLDREHADSAMITGIQIHGPHGGHFIWPGIARAVVAGESRKLDLGK
jgi:hypothetical protein